MSALWPDAPIGELSKLINGRAFKPSDWSAKGVPIVRIQNLNDSSKPYNHFMGAVSPNHQIDTGDILLSWSGTPGTSFGCFRWLRGPAVLNQHIFKVLLDKDTVDGDFFIYAVNSRLEEIISHAHGGVGLRHITKNKLEAIRLPMPDLPEQRRIVARIKKCMERVEEIECLQIEAEFEAQKLGPALYEAIESRHEWPRIPVGQLIVRSRNGRSISKTNSNPTGQILSLSAVHDIRLNLEATKPIQLPVDIAQQFRIQEGDVFVSRSNTRELVGLASVSGSSPENTIFPDLLIKLDVNADIIRPRYLAYALRTQRSRQQIQSRAVGTSQSMVKISGQRLKEVEVPVPSLQDQDNLLQELDRSHSLWSEMRSKISKNEISHLRDSILRKAFAGEL